MSHENEQINKEKENKQENNIKDETPVNSHEKQNKIEMKNDNTNTNIEKNYQKNTEILTPLEDKQLEIETCTTRSLTKNGKVVKQEDKYTIDKIFSENDVASNQINKEKIKRKETIQEIKNMEDKSAETNIIETRNKELNAKQLQKQDIQNQKVTNNENHIHLIELEMKPQESIIKGKVNDTQLMLLVDTGAAVTAINETVWNKIKDFNTLSCLTDDFSLKTVNGEKVDILGKVDVILTLQDYDFPFEVYVIRNLNYDGIIGRDFLTHFNSYMNFEDGTIKFNPTDSILPFVQYDDITLDDHKICSVHAQSSVTLQPYSQSVISGVVEGTPQTGETGVLIPKVNLSERYSIFGASELVKVLKENHVPVRLLNPTANPIKIYHKTRLANLEIVDSNIETYTLDKAKNKDMSNVSFNDQPTLSKLPDLSKSTLNVDDKQRLHKLLAKYHGIFATTQQELGRTSLIKHTIDTGTNSPIKQRPYRTSPDGKREIEKQVQEMCENNIAQPSTSPWGSPVVLVKKKDGTMRFCVDYRKLNAVTKKDSFPLPLISEVLDSLNETKFFSTLDLKSGYWQIELDPVTQEKTAFVTHNGLFEFSVLPFGLTNSPASFQRLMGHILRGLEYKCALIYIDDIIIFSKTIDDHLKHLEEVFLRLNDANLKLNPTKCVFAKQEIEYLGHIVTQDGIKPDPNKLKAVNEFPIPTDLKQLRSFLGLANYYRRFVKDFALIASPLHQLTKKSVKFCWTPQCQEAFDKLKTALVSAPILAYPNFTKPFHLFVDASSTGIGMTLAQISSDGIEHAIAHNGRNLNQSEMNYSTTEREALALAEAIKKYQPYLHGRKFTVHTDHNALQWLMRVKNPVGRLARWALMLQQFDFDIVYRSGRSNGNADGLSRRNYEKCELFAISKDIDYDVFYNCQRRDQELLRLSNT